MLKQQLWFFLSLIFSLNSYSQILFENGYFIDNTGQKTKCLIRNSAWKNNPSEFRYKISEQAEPQKLTIESTREFGIDGVARYLRDRVRIDRSSENVNRISDVKKPEFKTEELFLEVLVEGKANLYQYSDESLKRFFYNIEDGDIEQLVYKSYKKSESSIGENNRFRQQLWEYLPCDDITILDIETIAYEKDKLIDYFIKYNSCKQEEFTVYSQKKTKGVFHLNFRPGFKVSTLNIQSTAPSLEDFSFENEPGFRIGLEAEFMFPFNKNKWAAIIEPTYQNFKSETEAVTRPTASINRSELTRVSYQSIELSIGVRHYFFLNDQSKLFLNGSLVLDFSSNSRIEFESREDVKFRTLNNLAFGAGYKFLDKYSLEARYNLGRDVLAGYAFLISGYNTFSITFGYGIY